MKQGLAEILQQVSSKATKKERIEELSRHSDNLPLRTLVVYALHPDVKFLLPKGEPPYKPTNKEEDLQGILIGKVKKLNMFTEKGGYGHMNQSQREKLFIQLLESVDPDDAKLLVSVKDKKIPYVTRDTVEKAWPGFTSTWDSN